MCVLGTVEKSKTSVRCLEPESVEPQSTMGAGVSTAEIIEQLVLMMGDGNDKMPLHYPDVVQLSPLQLFGNLTTRDIKQMFNISCARFGFH